MTLVGGDFRLSAQRAHQLGLVDEVVDGADLLAAAHDIARSIAVNSPAAVSLSKQAIWRSREVGYREAAEYAWSLVRMHWAHPDFAEGPAALGEGRAPKWAEPEVAGIERAPG
jgi:enoyl-CoA hydratase/carnithine racemase